MIDSKTAFSVTSLNKYIKNIFDNNFSLRGLTVKGEISNYKKYPSGHIYFTLKDEESVVKAVMFYDYAKYLKTDFKDGDEVLASGRVSVYPSRGEYQLYVDSMELFGAGAQLLELELLKKKLAAEGLFDESRKRKINLFPKAVGVICAPNSAAMADITTNLLRRYPLLEVKKFPSLVQGSEAPKELLKALKEAENSKIDTLIIGRGGGASEDLSAFNDETLVREAAKFPVPIISAVGHEIDFTLIDYVADARASTPTGAAELATIDKREIYEKLNRSNMRLYDALSKKIELYREKINSINNRSFFKDPKSMYVEKLKYIEATNEKLDLMVKHLIEMNKQKLKLKSDQLKSLSPDSVLNRGYSIMSDSSGKIVKSINDVKINDIIKTKLQDGTLSTKVIDKGE